MLHKLCLLSRRLACLPSPRSPRNLPTISGPHRHWFHVNTMIVDNASPLFGDLGGLHNVYINSAGEAALKKGVAYPNKTMFVTDLHDFTTSDGSYVERARKALAIMLKD